MKGVPGLGKTLLARTLADALKVTFRRIQFTSDIMPADVIGTYVVMEDHGKRKFEFQQGPLFANLVLADEINRATPKTQSALLEGLEEGLVTVANHTYELPLPFFVIATQSPGDSEGTFPLPLTQLDRFFFKIQLPFPSLIELDEIMQRTTEAEGPVAEEVLTGARIMEMSDLVRQVAIAPEVRQYAIKLVMATHPDSELSPAEAKPYLQIGSSPRGAQAMILAGKIAALREGRLNVSVDDIRSTALPALRHRIVLSFAGHADNVTADDLLKMIIKQITQ